MRQISEREDLSRAVLNVDLNSPIFKPMLEELNVAMIEVLKKAYNGEFESGDISLKITLAVPTVTKKFPVEGSELGEHPVVKTYEYKALNFKHNITKTLKKVDKVDGEYFGEKELKKDDTGDFVEVPIENPQISIFD
ncbi:hypothetical protein [Clostridium hydrogenum]|uniref:hypothetical protein n=1 Tax=Clostridium hydrogenum TaxID=2855764 RepID=UPI001F1718A9|nr:hypothetical protein [Clostridium hydrogenum]